ncbi:MAG: flagellar motor switch protein FliN [Deltaproteobacteria bacterium HGW-Deltaproteobacteria-14]|jgi:flagellar motor switch protein FliN/FliY|nr:MAG: flagellar motor switch protein FliN [Deltaproteobacteria bacterium HGW-Deltaproteobacteria-14]
MASTEGNKTPAPRTVEFLLDVPLRVTVELGRTKMAIADLLKLAKGSVVELEKVAGEPLDVRVNGQLIARGEAVIVNDKFGVRLSDVISPSERVRSLS